MCTVCRGDVDEEVIAGVQCRGGAGVQCVEVMLVHVQCVDRGDVDLEVIAGVQCVEMMLCRGDVEVMLACIKGQPSIIAEANDAIVHAFYIFMVMSIYIATVPVIFTTSIESDGTIATCIATSLGYVGIHGKIPCYLAVHVN